jgi:hypothetical protein
MTNYVENLHYYPMFNTRENTERGGGGTHTYIHSGGKRTNHKETIIEMDLF